MERRETAGDGADAVLAASEPLGELVMERPRLVTIRAARREDLVELERLVAALAAHHGDASCASATGLERDLFSPRPWARALVAEGDAGLIGYAILVPLYRALEASRGMDLHHLFVTPAHRGHGIGRHLVARARDLARQEGCDFLSVSAATGNLQAHRFYETMHFVPRPVTGMRYLQRLG